MSESWHAWSWAEGVGLLDQVNSSQGSHEAAAGLQGQLILCLGADEIGDCEIALKIGRLMGATNPRLLQVLVFATDWDRPRAKKGWFTSASSETTFSQENLCQAKLLTWCGQLTRSLAGHCAVTVTMMPLTKVEQNREAADLILKNIVRRSGA